LISATKRTEGRRVDLTTTFGD